MLKKIVVRLDLHGKNKQKAMAAVSVLLGVDSISVDMAARKMTVIGTVDPVDVQKTLRKARLAASIYSVGPAKEPEEEEEGDRDGDKEHGGDGKKGKKEDSGGEKNPPTVALVPHPLHYLPPPGMDILLPRQMGDGLKRAGKLPSNNGDPFIKTSNNLRNLVDFFDKVTTNK